MSTIWLIGDTHFGHEKVAKIRGFDSVEQHDLEIFDTWQRQVSDDDRVIVVGDISSGREEGELHALEILSQLRGHKTLVCGNHDSVSGIHRKPSPHTELFRSVFESIYDFTRIRINKLDVLISHYPYISHGDGPGRGEARYGEFRLPDTGKLLIHAHTHHTDPTDGSVTGREYCVSWDAHRELVNIGKISKWVQSIEPVERKGCLVIDLDSFERVEGGFRIRSTEEYVIEVHKMLFNWRLIVMPPDQEAVIDRAFCYFGTGPEVLTRAILAGLAWEDPYKTDPVGYDKHAF